MCHSSDLITGNGQHGKLTPDRELVGNHLARADSKLHQVGGYPACRFVQFPVGVAVTTVIHHIFPVRVLRCGPLPAVQKRLIFPVPLLSILFQKFRIDFPFLKHNLPPSILPQRSRIRCISLYMQKARTKRAFPCCFTCHACPGPVFGRSVFLWSYACCFAFNSFTRAGTISKTSPTIP